MCTFIQHTFVCVLGVTLCVGGGMSRGMCGWMRRMFDVVAACIGSKAGGHLAVGGRTAAGAAYTRTRHDSAWRFQGHEYLSAAGGGRLWGRVRTICM
jgi:hypothetical protein